MDHLRRVAGSHLFEEGGEDLFGFAKEKVVRVAAAGGTCRGVRSSGDHPLPKRLRPSDDRVKRSRLDYLASHQDQVGPAQRLVVQRADVEVRQTRVAVRGEERGDGEQSQRWKGRTLAGETGGVFGAPICLWKLWADEEDVHGSALGLRMSGARHGRGETECLTSIKF